VFSRCFPTNNMLSASARAILRQQGVEVTVLGRGWREPLAEMLSVSAILALRDGKTYADVRRRNLPLRTAVGACFVQARAPLTQTCTIPSANCEGAS
jgi:hypothetical protein